MEPVLSISGQTISGSLIGFLFGIVSGAAFGFLLFAAFTVEKFDLGSGLKLSTALFAMPAAWFGGSWVTSSIGTAVQFEKALNPYLLSLAITFVSVATLIMLIRFRGRTSSRRGAVHG